MFHIYNILYPDGHFKSRWNFVALLGIFWYGIEVPLSFIFDISGSLPVIIVDIILTLFFSINIFINSKTAYYKSGKIILNEKEIRKHYFKGWFWLDLIATLPLDMLFLYLGFPMVAKFFRLNRLLRVIRIFNLFQTQNRFLDLPIIVRLVQYVMCSAFAFHWISCLWLVLGNERGEGLSDVSFYIESIYWTVTTLTTVGYGDITPSGDLSRIYTMVVMLFGVGMYGFVIGNISTLLAKIDSGKAHQKQKMNDLSSYMEHCEVPSNLQKEVFIFYTHLLGQSYSGGESTLSDLPDAMRRQLQMYSNLLLIKKVPMFQGLEQDCLKSLANVLKQVIVAPNEKIIQYGEIGDEMFFLGHGSVEVLTKDDTQLAVLHEGSFFGEIALMQEVTRTATIRTMNYCDLYKMEKVDFLKILNTYKGLREKIEQIMSEEKR